MDPKLIRRLRMLTELIDELRQKIQDLRDEGAMTYESAASEASEVAGSSNCSQMRLRRRRHEGKGLWTGGQKVWRYS